MATQQILKVQPHEQIVLGVVQKAALGETATRQLETEVSAAASARPGVPVVLDMTKVRFMPSVALGALVNLGKGLNLEGRPLILIHVNRQVHGTIKVTRLDQLLVVLPDLDAVVEHLGDE
jgi:anti-anti-sigma factor